MKELNTSLINEQGCSFDSATFTSMKRLKGWAKGRGGEYSVFVNGDKMFKIKNDRFYNVQQ